MSIYIYKNNRSNGPFEENNILEWLKNGQLTLEDFACRHGAREWIPLRTLLSQNAPPAQTGPIPAVNAPANSPVKASDQPVLRKTTLQKIMFGLLVLGFLAAFLGSLLLMQRLSMPSGDLETDLATAPYRIVARDGAVGIFIGLVLGLTAFALAFKKKLIRTYGWRIFLRCFFVILVAAAVIQSGAAIFNYMNFQPPYRPPTSPSGQKNSLVVAMEEGEDIAARDAILAFHLPFALGLLAFGAAGFSMTQMKYPDES